MTWSMCVGRLLTDSLTQSRSLEARSTATTHGTRPTARASRPPAEHLIHTSITDRKSYLSSETCAIVHQLACATPARAPPPPPPAASSPSHREPLASTTSSRTHAAAERTRHRDRTSSKALRGTSHLPCVVAARATGRCLKRRACN